MQSNQTQQVKHVISYDFADFLTQFQEAVQDGYHLDLEANEHYPSNLMGQQYIVSLVKDSTKTQAKKQEQDEKKEPVVEKQQEEPKTEVQPEAKKPGRKPANKAE